MLRQSCAHGEVLSSTFTHLGYRLRRPSSLLPGYGAAVFVPTG